MKTIYAILWAAWAAAFLAIEGSAFALGLAI